MRTPPPFQEFFLANDVVAEGKKVAILLSSLNPKLYEKVKALCAPAGPSDLKWEVNSDKPHLA